jgi:vacuolar-type H+-ATPase subunit H
MSGSQVERAQPIRDPAVLAMEHVLEAERAAEIRLEACQRQADAAVAAARERAAAIARRADTRLSRVHGRYLERIDVEASKLKSARAADAAADTGIDEAALAAVTRRLAAKLTV